MGRSFARSKKRQDLTSKSLAYVVLIVACLLVIAPFTIVIATSFKTYQDSVKIPFSFYMGYLDTSSYKEIITDEDLWNGLMNTLIIVVPIMFIGVFFSALSAFAFAKLRFRNKKLIFFTLLISSDNTLIVSMGVKTFTSIFLSSVQFSKADCASER